MEWIADPSIWAGLITLIVIELVLGIDNLVFIAILAEKLPPAQRDRARITGLLLAMIMRLLLLASISWLVTLTKPLFSIRDLSFSARDLIMLFGGFFLLFKATMELNERLEGKDSDNPHPTQRGEILGRGGANCGAGRHLLPRLGHYRRGDGRTPCGDDGGGDYRHQPDAAGQ
ncbi:transport protein [Citrobacter koseri]|nr:transport protein [Citrobacter koseri]